MFVKRRSRVFQRKTWRSRASMRAIAIARCCILEQFGVSTILVKSMLSIPSRYGRYGKVCASSYLYEKARFESREGYISTKLDTKMVGSFFAPSSLLKLRFAKSSTALTKTVVDGHAQWSQLASVVGQRLAGTDAEPWLCSARAPSDHMPAPWPGVWFECSSLSTHLSKVRGSTSVGTGFPHSFTRPPVRTHRGRHPARSGRPRGARRKVAWFRTFTYVLGRSETPPGT